MSSPWICVISHVIHLCILHGNNFQCWTLQAKSFIPARLVGTIDHYHFMALSVALTLFESHNVSKKQNLLLHFPTGFSTDQDKI